MYRKSSGLSLSTNVESPTIMFSCDGFNVTALARFTQALMAYLRSIYLAGDFQLFTGRRRSLPTRSHELVQTFHCR